MGFYSINNETNTNSILENMNLEDIHYTPDLADYRACNPTKTKEMNKKTIQLNWC